MSYIPPSPRKEKVSNGIPVVTGILGEHPKVLVYNLQTNDIKI